MPRDHVLYAFVIVALLVLGIVVLAALQVSIPGVLQQLAVGIAFGGAALATPVAASSSTSDDTTARKKVS